MSEFDKIKKIYGIFIRIFVNLIKIRDKESVRNVIILNCGYVLLRDDMEIWGEMIWFGKLRVFCMYLKRMFVLRSMKLFELYVENNIKVKNDEKVVFSVISEDVKY